MTTPSTSAQWKLVPVEPTPEMLKASAGTSTCHPPSWNRAMWSAFLAAAPASPSPAASPASPSGVQVKPLEWEPKTGGCTATGLGINYAMGEEEPGLFCLYHPFHTEPMSKEHVQALAQADYEARILSALASDAAPAPTSGSEDVVCDAVIDHTASEIAGLVGPNDEAQAVEAAVKRALVFMRSIFSVRLAKPASEPAGGDVWRTLIADLAAVVRVQNGNRHADINALLARADAALSSSAGPAEPIEQWQWAGCGHSAWFDGQPPFGTRPDEIEKRTLYAHPAPATVESDEVSVAARFNRLAAICRRIKWRNVGEPAWNDKQTADALFDLAEWLFADGVDAALAPATEGRKG